MSNHACSSADMYPRVKEEAERLGVPMSSIVDAALNNYFAKANKGRYVQTGGSLYNIRMNAMRENITYEEYLRLKR